MLNSAQRLRQSSDFKRVMRAGRRATSGRVVAHVAPAQSVSDRDDKVALRDGSRVGLVVSKAVGGAVQRNLVKRRLRAAAHGYLSSTAVSAPEDVSLVGDDIVLRALPGAAERRYQELADDVSRAIDRARRSPSGKRS